MSAGRSGGILARCKQFLGSREPPPGCPFGWVVYQPQNKKGANPRAQFRHHRDPAITLRV
jgi:hypothetical protein